MKIFILEDDRTRVVSFKKWFKADDVTITDSSDEAIALIEKDKYDLIMLDHDLGGRQYVDSKEYDTGFRVAEAIPGSINKDTRVIVHSHNPIGAQNMKNVLKSSNAVVIPFGQIYIDKEKR